MAEQIWILLKGLAGGMGTYGLAKIAEFDLWVSSTIDSFQVWVKADGFGYQLSMSLFSAVIFYLVFSFAPMYFRRAKLRPVLILDFIQLRGELLAFFDLVMRESREFSTDYYQVRVIGGGLTKGDLSLGLQNKCIAEIDRVGGSYESRLIPIGEQLRERTRAAEVLIDKIFNLSEFAKAQEILLVEKIRKDLNMYKLDSLRFVLVKNCAQLAHAYYPLYLNFMKLQALIYENKFSDRDGVLKKILYFRALGNSRRVRKMALKAAKEFPSSSLFFRMLVIESDFLLGRMRAFYSGLDRLHEIKNPDDTLLSYRKLIVVFSRDCRAVEILVRHFGRHDYDSAMTVLKEEKDHVERFEKGNIELRDYFASLLSRP